MAEWSGEVRFPGVREICLPFLLVFYRSSSPNFPPSCQHIAMWNHAFWVQNWPFQVQQNQHLATNRILWNIKCPQIGRKGQARSFNWEEKPKFRTLRWIYLFIAITNVNKWKIHWDEVPKSSIAKFGVQTYQMCISLSMLSQVKMTNDLKVDKVANYGCHW